MPCTRFRRATLVLVSIFLVVCVAVAAANDDDDPSKLTAGWNGEDVFIKSSDDQFLLEIGGRIHLDFRAYSGELAPPSTFLVRRARLKVEGELYRMFEFKVQADFADDEAVLLRDGFVNVHPRDIVQVMAGQFKSPFSQEEYQSSKYMTFVERSMINNIVPGRSPGVMVHGFTENAVVSYAASVQNDEGELGLNHEGGLGVFGQGRFKPWTEGVLETLSFGGAVGYGKRDEERFVVGRTSSRSIVFFDKVPLNGTLLRRNVEGWWFPGPLLVQSEYDDLGAERNGLGSDGSALPDVKARGFMVQAAFVLTGETNYPDDPLVPRRPVHEGGPGAWEIAGRYQFFEIEGDELVNRVDDITVAVNWWLNRFIRYQANVSFEIFRNPPDPTTGETFNLAFVTRLNMHF